MITKNVTAKQDKKQIARPFAESQHLPVVITSAVARNRLSQMRSNINQVKLMNPTKFGQFVNR